MQTTHPKVDGFLAKPQKWQPEMLVLRDILLDSPLTEDFKWYKPCYTFQGANLIGMAALKDHCWLLFLKGALLDDPQGILTKAGDNSQSARVIKFTSVEEIMRMQGAIHALIDAAITAEKSGLKVDFKESTDLKYPQELLDIFDNDPDFKAAFDALTPGRQRGYNLQFTAAKQPQTRIGRITKSMANIFDGKGPNDR